MTREIISASTKTHIVHQNHLGREHRVNFLPAEQIIFSMADGSVLIEKAITLLLLAHLGGLGRGKHAGGLFDIHIAQRVISLRQNWCTV
jgi:hypothetical protein